MKRLGQLDRYVLSRTLSGVGVALLVITALITLIQFEELSKTVGGRSDAGVAELFYLTALKVPGLVLLLLPFVFLFGGIGAYVALNRRSELIAMRAAGISAWSFILPSASAALIIGALVVGIANPLAANLSERFEIERARMTEGYLSTVPKDVWLRQGDDASLTVIHAKLREYDHGSVLLKGVSLFIYRKDPTGHLQFSRRMEAKQARLEPGHWQLTDVREASAGQNSIHSDSLSLRSTLDSEAAMDRFSSTEAVSFWNLPKAISETELAGFSAKAYRLRFQQLLATPVLFAAMSILAAAFSLRLTRLGGLAPLAGAGAGIGFLIFFFNQVSSALAGANFIPIVLGAWAPSLVALLSGLTLLCYTEDS